MTNRAKLVRWYWNGVFGELYGSAVEIRFARDFMEVPAWLREGELPTTIQDATFRAERLKTMRMRLSAAYKGVNALLMNDGAQDLRSGQKFDHTVFFGENVDIHHIFPKKWCEITISSRRCTTRSSTRRRSPIAPTASSAAQRPPTISRNCRRAGPKPRHRSR